MAGIDRLRRQRKYSTRRIATELAADGVTILVWIVSRHLLQLGLNQRRFLGPTGQNNHQSHGGSMERPGGALRASERRNMIHATWVAPGLRLNRATRQFALMESVQWRDASCRFRRGRGRVLLGAACQP